MEKEIKKEEEIKTPEQTGVIKQEENRTESDKKELLQPIELTKEQKEQERTKVKKELFLKYYRKTLGSIGVTCEKIDMMRSTYYEWLRKDPVFNQKIRASFADKLNDVEQQLNQAVLKGDVGAIRYFLDRRHPLYMPKVKVVAPQAGEKSIEDMIIEGEWKDTNEVYENDIESESTVECKDNNRETLQDKKQEGDNSTIQTEQSADILLVKEDEKKPDTKIQAGGIKQNN
jgi:hypothetical protein